MCSETVDREVEKSAYSIPPLGHSPCWHIRNAGKSRGEAVKPTQHSPLLLDPKNMETGLGKPPLHELGMEVITF